MLHQTSRFAAFIIAASAACVLPCRAQVDVYFTQSVDSTLAMSPSNVARHVPDVSVIVADRLRLATSTIDIAMYNLNVQRMVDGLIAAHRRGVRVRVIAHVENVDNPATRFQQLRSAGIAVHANPRAASGAIQPLMHNKFIVIDARIDTLPTTVTGSWNATVAQTYSDANNLVLIRDSAVAGAYLKEFEEMWGGDSAHPNIAASRFGAQKQDNTDHTFTLRDGTRLSLWFSPSDGVESHIRDVISTAQTSIFAANLTITSGVLANQINQQKNRGADARVLIENIDDQGGQYGFLSGLVDTRSTAGVAGLLHHKYGIVDAMPIGAGSLPLVITGSHNWTFSANTINDENTVVIYSASVANQFLQEFAARYVEAGGTRSFGVSSVDSDKAIPFAVYPNPFTSTLTLSTSLDCDSRATLVDVLGRVVATQFVERGSRTLHFSSLDGRDETLLLTMLDCSGSDALRRVVRIRTSR